MIEGEPWGKRQRESLRRLQARGMADARETPHDDEAFDERRRGLHHSAGRPIQRDSAAKDRRAHVIADLDRRIAGVEDAIEEARRARVPAARHGREAAADWGVARSRAEQAAAALSKAELDRGLAHVEQAIEEAVRTPSRAARWSRTDATPRASVGHAGAEAAAALLQQADLAARMAHVERAIAGTIRMPFPEARGRRPNAALRPAMERTRAEAAAAALKQADLARSMAHVEQAIEEAIHTPSPHVRSNRPDGALRRGTERTRAEDAAAALQHADLAERMADVEQAIDEATRTPDQSVRSNRPDAAPRRGTERTRAEAAAAALQHADLAERMADVEQAIGEAIRTPSPHVRSNRPEAALRRAAERTRAEAAAAALQHADLAERMGDVEQAIEEATRTPSPRVRSNRPDTLPRPGNERTRIEAATAALQHADLARSMVRVAQAIEPTRRASVSEMPWDRTDAMPRIPLESARADDAGVALLHADVVKSMARIAQAIEAATRAPLSQVSLDTPEAAPGRPPGGAGDSPADLIGASLDTSVPHGEQVIEAKRRAPIADAPPTGPDTTARPGTQHARPEDAVADLLQAELGKSMVRVRQAIETAREVPVPDAHPNGADATPRAGTGPAKAEHTHADLLLAGLDKTMPRIGRAIEEAIRSPAFDAAQNGPDATPPPDREHVRADNAVADLLQAELGKSVARVRQAIETARQVHVPDARPNSPDAAPRASPGQSRAEGSPAPTFKAELGAIQLAFEQVASRLAAIEKISRTGKPVVAPPAAGQREAGLRPNVEAASVMRSGSTDVIRGSLADVREPSEGPGRGSASFDGERILGRTQPPGSPKPPVPERAATAQQVAWEAAGAAKLSAALSQARGPHLHAAADARAGRDFERLTFPVPRFSLAQARPIFAALAIFVAGAVATTLLRPNDHAERVVAQSSHDGERVAGLATGATANRRPDWPDATTPANAGDVPMPPASVPPALDYDATGSTARIEPAMLDNRAVVSPTLERSAESGDTGAEVELASIYANRSAKNDLAAAAYWYERAAQQGDAAAQYRLAYDQENGIGVPRNVGKALRWYSQAAKAGNPLAMHELGILALADNPPDYVRAAAWFQSAADRGVPDSQYRLGLLLADGSGTPKSLTDAYRWFDIAARNGQRDAETERDETADRLNARDLAAARAAAAAFRPIPIGGPGAQAASSDADAGRSQPGSPSRSPTP